MIRFWGALSATTNFFVTDAPDSDNYFPDNDFFSDVDNLLDDMAGKDTDPKTGASALVSYVLILFLLEVLSQLLALVSVLDVFGSSSYMQMLFTFSLSNYMTCFISAILVMLYLIFLLIKLFGKLLIFPTISGGKSRLILPMNQLVVEWLEGLWYPQATRVHILMLAFIPGFISGFLAMRIQWEESFPSTTRRLR